MGQAKYRGLTRSTAHGPSWTGKVVCDEASLDVPLRWRKPRFVFVNSMSDLFHADVPEPFIRRVWNTMAAAPQHTFQILTKRPRRIAASARGARDEGPTGRFQGRFRRLPQAASPSHRSNRVGRYRSARKTR